MKDGLPLPQRYYALISTALGTFTSSLDFGVVNVALPTISLALGVPAAQAIWIVTANQLAVIATLLLFAALGDSLGVKRMYLPALFAFMLATSRLRALTGIAFCSCAAVCRASRQARPW